MYINPEHECTKMMYFLRKNKYCNHTFTIIFVMDGRCHLTCFSFELVPLHDYIMLRGKHEVFSGATNELHAVMRVDEVTDNQHFKHTIQESFTWQ
jgi:hypothetical protein